MARDPKTDPEKVGVYDSTPKDSTSRDADRSPKKKSGMPVWLIALLVIIVIVLLIIFLF